MTWRMGSARRDRGGRADQRRAANAIDDPERARARDQPARAIGGGYVPAEGDEEYAQLVPDEADAAAAAARSAASSPAEAQPTTAAPETRKAG